MAAIRPTSLTDTMLRLCGHLALALIRPRRSRVPLQPKPGPSPVPQPVDPRVAGVYGVREGAAAPTSHLLDPNPEIVLYHAQRAQRSRVRRSIRAHRHPT